MVVLPRCLQADWMVCSFGSRELENWGSMGGARRAWAVAFLVWFSSLVSETVGKTEQVTHTQTFHSPAFELGPGDVIDRYYLLEIPQGHIGMRDFQAEVVDENSNPVRLTEVYLHHWTVHKFLVKEGHKQLVSSVPKTLDLRQRHTERMAFQEGADVVAEENKESTNTCNDDQSSQFLGIGSETRHTKTALPSPYALVTGDTELIPEGYEEAWYINVHAINTRDAVNADSCHECLCEAYGVTQDSSGRPLGEGYIGVAHCCYDNTHCPVREGSNPEKTNYFMKYVVTWVDWDPSVVPVRTYVIDVTDSRTSIHEPRQCKTEYSVPQCGEGSASNECVDHRHAIATVPIGGDLIYSFMHQHPGGLGGILYYEGGAELCSSNPIYGKGTEPGDEEGYIVGMTSCYPKPGSIYLESMKEMQVDAYYSNEVAHSGVMSLFIIKVADHVTFIEEVTE